MITDRRGRCRCHHGRQIARTRSPVHMAAMYRRLHRLLPRHPRQLLTDKCFPAHLRCAPDCMSCCLPTCRCTPRGVLHLAASPMRLSGRVGDPAGRRTPCGHTWGTRQADTAIALRRCAGYFYGFWQPGMHCGRPHLRLLSGRVGDPAGRRTPCGTHGAPGWPTPPSRFGDAQQMGK